MVTGLKIRRKSRIGLYRRIPTSFIQDAPSGACERSLRLGALSGAPPDAEPQQHNKDAAWHEPDGGISPCHECQDYGHKREQHSYEDGGNAVLLQGGSSPGQPLKRTPRLEKYAFCEERERATPREVQRDFSTRSGGRSVVFGDAVSGVPAAADVELAGRAVQGRRCHLALVGGAPAVCTAHDEHRLRPRQRGRGHSRVLYAYAGDTWSFHLIGKVGSVRHPRMASASSFVHGRLRRGR